jgi:hypothetical protein
MASSATELIVPVATPLPDVPPGDPFTKANWDLLMAIMDTVIPSIQRESASSKELNRRALPDLEYNAAVDRIKKAATNAPSSDLLDIYLNENPSSIPRFRELLRMLFMHLVPAEGRKKMAFILGALKYVMNEPHRHPSLPR